MEVAAILTALYESYFKVEIVIELDIEVEVSGIYNMEMHRSKGFVAAPDDLERGLIDALDEAISGLPKGWRVE